MGINDYIKIGTKIKNARLKFGIKQADMAARLKLSKSTYSNYENEYREPPLEVIVEVCDILDITMEELLETKPFSYGMSYDYLFEGIMNEIYEYSETIGSILEYLIKINDKGKTKVLIYTKELYKSNEYLDKDYKEEKDELTKQKPAE